MGYMRLYAMLKGDDEETYKKYAQKGMDLIYPVSINGESHRPDIGIRYHNSVKVFDPEKDNKEQIHEKASKLDLAPPNPEEVGIEPTVLEGRGGYKMHVLRMHGPHAEKIQQHNAQFQGMGHEQNYVFHPHITVDKATWDRVKNSGAKTAHEAGIKFHNAELRHGPAIVNTYHPKLAASEDISKSDYGPKKLDLYNHADNQRRKMTRTGETASVGPNKAVRQAGPTKNDIAEHQARLDRKKSKKNPVKVYSKKERKKLARQMGVLAASEQVAPMDKGIKHVAAAIGLAGALAAAPTQAKAPAPAHGQAKQTSIAPTVSNRQPASIPRASYSPQRMLHTIARVESANGKLENHKPIHGQTAYGKYGLMPNTIHETIHMNPDLSSKHKKAQSLQGDDLKHYMQDNPDLEDAVASRHLSRLEHHFGKDPGKLGYAWLNGIRGTYQADKQKKDINNHWHVKKIKAAYDEEK